jgi:protein TonB
MTSALEEIETAPASPELIPQAASLPLPSSSDLGDYSSTGLVSSDADFKNSAVASVEPLIAESKQTEAEASQPEKSTPEVSEPSRAVPEPGAATPSEGGLLASDQPTERKTRGPLVALLLLVLVAGGFYAAWTYQPGFQDVVQSQINHLLALVGMAPLSTPPPPPAKPLAHIIPAPAPAPAPLSPADPSKIQSTVSDSATGSATSSAAGSATVPPATGIPAPTPSQSPTPATKAVPPASGSKAPLPSSDSKQEPGKASDGSKDQAPPAPSNAPLAEENSAIILSSKGAEKRLAYSFAPKYPAEAHAEGTIVLKEVVDANGKVEGIRLIEGDAALASIAIQAVKQWRYRPFVRDGKALPFQTVVIIDFQHP